MGSRTYRLIVEGELGGHVASVFPGMRIIPGDGTTTLVGELRDQAELQGMLQRISDLGLTLVETKAIKGHADGRSNHDSVSTEAAERDAENVHAGNGEE